MEFAGFMNLTTPMRTGAALPAENAMELEQPPPPSTGGVGGGGIVGMELDGSAGLSASSGGMQHQPQHVIGKPKLSSSTSTIYVRSSHPANLDSAEVLSAIASVLQVIMNQAHTGNDIAPPVDMNLAVFDERSYVAKDMRKKLRWGGFSFRRSSTKRSGGAPSSPADVEANQEGVPPKEVILEFLSLASKRASFSAETTIIALILINRLLSTTTYQVHTFNWRLLWLSALLLAQKLQDDVSLDNASFLVVWRYATKIENDSLTVVHFNEMESKVRVVSGVCRDTCERHLTNPPASRAPPTLSRARGCNVVFTNAQLLHLHSTFPVCSIPV
jgi:hypothetical protein